MSVMKRIITASWTAAFTLGLSLTLSACGQSPATSDVAESPEGNDIQFHIEPVETPADILGKGLSFAEYKSAEESSVKLAAIVNTAKQAWKFIVDNQPVSNVSHLYANALPRGLESAADLDGFSDLQYSSYRMWGTNGFGMTVYDVTYTLVHQYGGNYEGKGKYLNTVTVLPSNVDVLWGYTVDYAVKNITTTNVGSADAPVGSLSMELQFKVSTVIKKHRSTQLFQFRGDKSKVLAVR